MARAIYQHSRRQDAPFVAINCAAIPETLLESELFGHEKGAFTGAEHRRIGKFEQAHGGTIFLDEIGDMSPATQARVLRVLQDGRFERVGGNDIVESDARVIAATNRDLEAAIGNREFRQDLFYRLNVFTIRLPPLRDRMVDLPRLVDHFRNRFNHDLKADVQSIAEPAMKLLRDYDWPGNIRELQSAVKYAVVRATGDVITADCLPAAVRGESSDHPLTADDSEALSIRNFVRSLLADGHGEVNDRVRSTVDRMVIQEVLNFVGGHQTRAAELLGISPTTLRARMQQLGLTLEKTVKPEDASPGPPKYP